jgi:nanoRNase/pAp phosphatase (c-di-AMP/oligoRNAs hydrolase)
MKNQLAKIFDEFFSYAADKRVVIATHKKADIDAVASAYALSSVFKNAVIAMPDEPTSAANKLAQHLNIKYAMIKDLEKSNFNGMIAVDTSSYELLKEAKSWAVIGIIDHHQAEGRDIKAKYEIIDETACATSELIANILLERRMINKNNRKVAFVLGCGIISDTARFKRAEKETFLTLAQLIELAGTTYNELLLLAEPEFEIDEKIAIIKSFQRVNYTVSNNFLIVTSEVGANESNAAAMLSEVADVAFVANWKKEENETRISARARKHVKIELNKIMAEVANAFNGKGGGHQYAAGASVKAKPEDAMKKCVEITIEALSRQHS